MEFKRCADGGSATHWRVSEGGHFLPRDTSHELWARTLDWFVAHQSPATVTNLRRQNEIDVRQVSRWAPGTLRGGRITALYAPRTPLVFDGSLMHAACLQLRHSCTRELRRGGSATRHARRPWKSGCGTASPSGDA
jgi:hypothetical protein